jgi:protein involved in polysaccharide export with SLBB domain
MEPKGRSYERRTKRYLEKADLYRIYRIEGLAQIYPFGAEGARAFFHLVERKETTMRRGKFTAALWGLGLLLLFWSVTAETAQDKAEGASYRPMNGKPSMEVTLRVFERLGGDEKRSFFLRMSDEERAAFFSRLSDLQKKEILERLTVEERASLLSLLPEVEKEKLRRVDPFMLREAEEKITEEEEVAPAEPKPPIPEAPSRIEEILSGRFPTDISRELKQYGYEFFNKEISTFSPVIEIPVGNDYVIGPGDVFTVNLWGKAESTYTVTVNRDGRVVIPRLGSVNVGGLSYKELEARLYRQFREYYPEFKMSVTMERLRTVDVFMVGEARYPGTYSVSSLATVISALHAAGGPTRNGSLRNIKLMRNGEEVAVIDLYDFFINGSKRQDLRLQPGDTIFIPVIGPTVGVVGNVRRPAIYELKHEKILGEIIRMAGGVLPTGRLQNVVVERVVGHEKRVVKSLNLETAQDALSRLPFPVQDFDVVKIYPVHERVRQVVYLEGHVKYPREHEFKAGMKLRDLIPSYEVLLPEPYLAQAEIVRLVPPDLHPEIMAFDLGAMLSGDETQNLALQDLDTVIVSHAWGKKERPMVTIKGEVREPGTYRLYEGMTVRDLIFKAGNMTIKSYKDEATLNRVMTGEKDTEIAKLTFSPGRALRGDPKNNLALKANDEVFIRQIPQYNAALDRRVVLEGEFLFPGEYAFSQGERLSSVIERAGGLTMAAYPLGAVFQREVVKDVQMTRLKEYADTVEEDILTASAKEAELSDEDQAGALKQSLEVKRRLLEKIRASRPTGRMVIDLEEAVNVSSSNYNFELRPGDHLIVGKRPDSVQVMGEVFNPTAVFAEKGRTVDFYLNSVGGPTDNADEDSIYVVKADGSVISSKQGRLFGRAGWDSEQYRWTMSGFEDTVLDPGDTIIVPRKIVQYPWAGITKDITTILFQIAVAAGVIIAAF